MSEPGRRPFFKYAASETTLAILKNQSLRFSSPLEFNDPFDFQAGLHLNFDLVSLPTKILDKYELLAKDHTIAVKQTDSIGKCIAIFREKYPTQGFPRNIFDQLIRPVLAQAVEEIERTRISFQKNWLDELSSTRVFCVSEDRDNLLMWAHYAKDHKGAVLELWSLPEEDNTLSVAKPVTYASEPPPFFTEDDFIDEYCGIKNLDLLGLTRQCVHSKSEHWKYEREWRVWYPKSEKPGLHEDNNLREKEFKAIYFGCRAEPSFVNEAKELVHRSFPTVKMYVASKRADAYALQYAEI